MDKQILAATQRWIKSIVLGLQLCPFAEQVVKDESLRYHITQAATDTALLTALNDELNYLDQNPSVATTLLIHPYVLTDFYIYNQFLDLVDLLLEQLDKTGVYQVASFHPDYQYAGTQPADIENYRNKSPYPMLHILREAGLDQAINTFPDVEEIPPTNIKRLQALGLNKMQSLLKDCG